MTFRLGFIKLQALPLPSMMDADTHRPVYICYVVSGAIARNSGESCDSRKKKYKYLSGKPIQ